LLQTSTSLVMMHFLSSQMCQSGRCPSGRTIPMLGNKVQEAFTDLPAQLRVRDTRQARYASVLTFCVSGTSIQQKIVRQRMCGRISWSCKNLGRQRHSENL
jgi:hypothetical protein